MEPQNPPIDYDAIAAKHGGKSAPIGVDYDAIAAKHGGTSSSVSKPFTPEATIGASTENPISGWFQDLKGDVKHGTQNTLPGKILHGLGAPGTDSGVPEGLGDVMGGALVGPAEVGHAVTSHFTGYENPGQKVRAANELVQGLGHTAAIPSMVAAPELGPQMVPNIAKYGVINTGVKSAATLAGANPDQAELAGNIGMMAGEPAASKTGKLLETHAPTIGKVAGVGGALAELAKTKNPLSLLLLHPSVANTATAASTAVGKGLQGLGDISLKDLIPGKPEVVNPPPKLLGPGMPQLPTPPEEPAPLLRPAAAQIIRGKGGKMTKQYLTSEAQPGQGPRFGTGVDKPLVEIPQEVSGTYSDGKLVPKDRVNTQPLTKGPEPDIINDMADKTQPNPATPVDNVPPVTDNPVNMSRRNFLKGGAKTAAASVLPKGPIGDLINSAIPQAAAGTHIPAIARILPFLKNNSFVGMNPKVREALNGVGLTDEAIKNGTYTLKNIADARGILGRISEDYDAMSDSKPGNGAWKDFGLGGDDDLDFNVGIVHPALDLLEGIKEAKTLKEAHELIDENEDVGEYNYWDNGPGSLDRATPEQIEQAEKKIKEMDEAKQNPQGKDNEDLIDTRGLQQELRQHMDSDQAKAAQHDPDDQLIRPWAETPWKNKPKTKK